MKYYPLTMKIDSDIYKEYSKDMSNQAFIEELDSEYCHK